MNYNNFYGQMNEQSYINQDCTSKMPILNNDQTKIILAQLENSVCKIYETKDNKTATGFLCKIPFPDQLNLLPVLITNNHVIKTEDLKINTEIKITFDDEKKNNKNKNR